MLTNALSFSSSTGMTLTSVISMLSAPSLVQTSSAHPRWLGPQPAILIEGERPAAQGFEPARNQPRLGLAGPAGVVEQAEVRRPAPRECGHQGSLSQSNIPGEVAPR